MKTTLLVLLTSALALHAQGGNATWKLDPPSGDWNTAANWTPETVPNGATDSAIFGISNRTAVTTSQSVELGRLLFRPGASQYGITVTPLTTLSLRGRGVVNRSGASQVFYVTTDEYGRQGEIIFSGGSSAGAGTTYHTVSSALDNQSQTGTEVAFQDQSTAGLADFEAEGGNLKSAFGGSFRFNQNASGGRGHFEIGGGSVKHAIGADVVFFEEATADRATIVLHGATAREAGGGRCIFNSNASAGSATIIARGSDRDGGDGGTIYCNDQSDGGTARVQLYGNALMDVSHRSVADVFRVGSIEGDGVVDISFTPTTVGTNHLSTTFSGLIEGQIFGTLEKVGEGTFTVSGANTYTGSTIVNGGTLLVANAAGSATGSGDVSVYLGTLGGGGTIAGSVTIGSGAGPGAVLAPGAGASGPTTTTIQSAFTCKADGIYTCKVYTETPGADQVAATWSVTLEEGAQLDLTAVGNEKLAAGTRFTVINNDSAMPIYGTFANLPKGGIISVGSNTFQARYAGGDGNDLTLTVMP